MVFCCDELSVIFSFLPMKDLVINEMLVCKHWRETAVGTLSLWTALLNTHFKWEDFVNPMFPDIEMELLMTSEVNDHYAFLKYLFSIIPKFKSVEEREEDRTIDQGDSLCLEQVFKFNFPLKKNVLVGYYSDRNLMKLAVILTSLISDEYRPDPMADQVILHQCFWDDNLDIVINSTKILIPLSLFCFIILISEGDGWFSILDLLFFKKKKLNNVKFSEIIYGVSPCIVKEYESDDEPSESASERLEQYVSQQVTPFCYFSKLDDNLSNESPTESSWEDYEQQLFPIFFNAGSSYICYQMNVKLNEEENLILVEKLYGSGYY